MQSGQAPSSGIGGSIGGAVDSQLTAQERAINEQRKQLERSQTQFDPYQQSGANALAQQNALLGMGGEAAQQEAFSAFGDSPGQKFLRDRQEKALLRNSAAMGGLGGGNVRTALQEQAAGIAAQDYNNQFNRLGNLAGQGLSATSADAQLGSSAASNIANINIASGEARASGILGQQQLEAQESEGIANILGMYSDEISSGLGSVFDYATSYF